MYLSKSISGGINKPNFFVSQPNIYKQEIDSEFIVYLSKDFNYYLDLYEYEKMGKKIINSDILLHHIDILINNRAEKKREKYRKGLETMLFSKNKIIDERYYLNMGFYAMEYIAIQEYDKAEDILLKALQKEIKFKPFLMVFLCQLYIIKNNFQKL